MTALARPQFRNDEHRRQHEQWKRARAKMTKPAPSGPAVVIPMQQQVATPVPAAPTPIATVSFGSMRFAVTIGGERCAQIITTRSQEIVREVSRFFNIPMTEIRGRSRSVPIVLARHVAIWRLRYELPHLSLPQIGKMMGGRDHTTAISAIRRVDRLISEGRLSLPAHWGRAPQ